MTTRHYRSENGITGYDEGDLLIDDTTGERSRVVRDGRGLVLQPEQPSTPAKSRTITLTGRRPVKIREDEWPIIASAAGDSYHGDPGRYRQAEMRGEIDEYRLIVRQRADGRALVYGILTAANAAWGQPAGGEWYRGGELLTESADIPAAIGRVGEDCHLPESVIRACIADLPAEDL